MGAVDALWLKLFSGEVLTAYEQAKVLKPTVRVRTVSGQKSAQFPATFNAVGRYHTVGSEITGQAIKHNEIVITLDDLLISDVFVAQIDELKNHYDVRAPYAQALGRALALIEDRTIGQCIVAAARGAELFAGDGGGSSVIESDIVGTGDFDADGGDLISAVNLAKQKLDEKDVPVDTMTVNAAFRPAQWYLIANSDKNLNRDFGGQSTVGSQVLRTVADIQIRKSTALLFGFDVSTYDAGTNTDGVVENSSFVAASTLPVGGALPFGFPTKYHSDITNTRGLVWVEPAVAYLQALGLQMESGWDMRRQGTLMIAKMAIGAGALRSKCAVEIATS
jgi:hypothetical protein